MQEATRFDNGSGRVQQCRSICCHCPARCGVTVEIVDGDPVAVYGDPTNPLTKGFICVRGRAAIEYFEHPGRINYALKRAGERGADKWQRVGWDEAIAEIADRIRRSTEVHGKESLAYLSGTYHGTDYSAGVRFMNLFGSPNYSSQAAICAGPRTEADFLTVGISPTAADVNPGVTRNVLVWGQRTSASNVPFYTRLLEVKRAGAFMTVIDPVQTHDAKAADLWLPIRPGADAALALGMLNVIIAEGLFDAQFVAEATTGFDDLRERARQFPPPRVAALTELGEEDIIQLARRFAEGPSIISSGMPNGMGRNALNFERARCALIVITGNLDRAGAHRLAGPPHRMLTKIDLELYDALPKSQRKKAIGADRFQLLSDGYELLNEAARKNWPHHRYLIASSRGAGAHGPSLFRAIRDARPYPVRSLIIQHANPIGSYTNAALVRDALGSQNLDLLVVQELFQTATSAFADFVLPAASWLEKPWMYIAGDSSSTVATPRPIPPRYERRTDYGLFRDLGRAFGQGESWPEDLEEVFDDMLRPAGVSFAEVAGRERNWISDPPPSDETKKYGTPSGLIELSSSVLRRLGYDPLPDFEEEKVSRPSSAFPLRLLTAATEITHTHQDLHQVATLRKLHPEPIVRMRQDTASKHGLSDGEWVWIESPLGRIKQRVKVTEGVPAETVESERWWYPEGEGGAASLFGAIETNVNVLTEDDPDLCDQAYGSWPLRDQHCRLRKIEA